MCLPRHGRYRRNVFRFRLSRGKQRRALDRQASVDARRSLARHSGGHRDAAGTGDASAADIGYFCHGTTVGTNALLEGKGARTGLLVTEGLSRHLSGAASRRGPTAPRSSTCMYDKPALLVPQSLTGEVAERVDFRGNVLRAARRGGAARDRARARRAGRRIDRGVPAVLVPASRARAARARDRRWRKCRIAASRCRPRSLPQIREYYRLRTTVINAYLQPILARYIAQLDQRLDERRASRRGRNTSCSRTAAWRPSQPPRARAVTTVLSGPAGGVTAGADAGRMTGVQEHHHLRHGRHVLRRGADQGRRAARSRAAARSKAATSRCR